MASLNTLRTKFGVLLTAVIAFALLAFILSLKTEMGFSGNDPKVGEINGEKIRYTEYLKEYEALKANSGALESNEQQLNMLENAAWQQLFNKYALLPGFEKMGIGVSENERTDLISGVIPTQTLYSYFVDRSGAYSVEGVRQFLAQAASNPQVATMWAALLEQARQEHEINKYLALVRGGVNVNDLEVAQGVAANNKNFSGKWAVKRFNTMPDSLYKVSDSEIKAYYNSHKEQFKQLPNRSISYAVFDITATDDDMLALEQKVRDEAAQFVEAEDIKAFVHANRNGELANHFATPAQLGEEEAAALTEGKTYGPALKNNVWTVTRVVESRVAPDSIGVRHMVVPYDQKLADSLATALRSGADFATVSEGSGREVVYPYSAFDDTFIEPMEGVKAGDVVTIPYGQAIHIMQVYKVGQPVKQYRTASIVYDVEPSAATRRDIHSKANLFAVEAAGSVEKFNEAASNAALTPRVATLMQGEREIRGLEDSREVVRWAADAKKGAVSQIFNLGDNLVVAVVTEIDDKEYTPVRKVAAQIRTILVRDKKFEELKGKLAGTTLEQAAQSLEAEVDSFKNVNYASYYVEKMGFEPRVVGAIASTAQTGVLAAPVKGNNGLFLFEVDAINDAEQPQTEEAERVRQQAMAESMMQQGSLAAIQQMADIKDLRAKYF